MSKPFEFKPEDFWSIDIPIKTFGYEDAYIPHVAFKMIADQANAKLKEWLDASPTVYGTLDEDGDNMSDGWREITLASRHKAKLVCTEPTVNQLPDTD